MVENPALDTQHLPSSISDSEVIIVNQRVAAALDAILKSAFSSRWIHGDF